MKRWIRSLITGICCTTVFLTNAAFDSHAAAPKAESVLVYGNAVKINEHRFQLSTTSSNAVHSEIVINISQEHTKIFDAVTGQPVASSEITDGELVYAYVGPAMTLSLPPMSTASLVLCNIPADYKVPQLVTVDSLKSGPGQLTATLTASDQTTYLIPENCTILPYLTRNIVTKEDLTKGTTCLIWSANDASKTASKIIIFPKDTTLQQQTGWIQETDKWYFYKEDGSKHTGWLLDQNKWYYLNPETGIMVTGFLTLDGKTYYLQADGSMLTGVKTFLPDQNGVLH